MSTFLSLSSERACALNPPWCNGPCRRPQSPPCGSTVDTAPWCTTCCSTREQPPQRHPSRLPVGSLRLPVYFAVAVLKSPEGAKRVGSKSNLKTSLPTSCAPPLTFWSASLRHSPIFAVSFLLHGPTRTRSCAYSFFFGFLKSPTTRVN